MNQRYNLAKTIHSITGWQVSYIFLALNIVFWTITSFLIASIGCYICVHTLIGYLFYLICAAAGTATVLGFYGGILFLYRHDK